ncbi:hypothetical protein [Thermococcus litoralis]|uniref:hypothetical protein n=1 Tax=Thermococcus litoralis TaxID=2265 RepID=UPI000B3629A5|nr:hypothetical protein [Thermococcus litoralis]
MRRLTTIFILGLVFFGFVSSASNNIQPGPVVVLKIENSTGAHIFVKALYPEGLREVGHYEAEGEEIYIDLRDLKRAWDDYTKQQGLGSESLLVITVVKRGNVAVQGVPLKWEVPVSKITIIPRFKPLKSSSSYQITSSRDIQPLAGYYEWLDDSEDKDIRAVVAEVMNLDSDSWGHLLYYYAAASRIGFGMYVFTSSEWSQIGYHYIYDVSGDNFKKVYFDGVQNGYIWMTFTYRYERWGIHIDGQTFYEEYVYIKSFDPSSLDGANYKPSDVKPLPIDNWETIAYRYSSSHRIPYYTYTVSGSSYSSSGVDALGFIDYLVMIGKITGTAAQAATLAGLFIDVSYEEISNQAYLVDFEVYGESGTWHTVKKGEATANVNNMNTVPIFAFKILSG